MKEIKTVRDLIEAFPDQAQELERKARAEAEQKFKDQMDRSVNDAVTQERQKIMGLVKLHQGSKAAQKVALAADAIDSLPDDENKLTKEQERDLFRFETSVNALVSYYGYSVPQAIKKCAQTLPDDHKDYVDRVQTGNVLPLGSMSTGGNTFEEAVVAYQKGAKCSAGQAIRAVALSDPGLHADYLKRLRSGKAENIG